MTPVRDGAEQSCHYVTSQSNVHLPTSEETSGAAAVGSAAPRSITDDVITLKVTRWSLVQNGR